VSTGARAAWWLFAAHAALIVFSTAAMLTVLTGSVEVTGEPAATIMRVSYRIAGPAYVVLGTLSALVFAGSTIGWRRGGTLAAVAITLSLAAELAGTSLGLPFGDYTYSGMLGYRIFGLVPVPIPLSWFYMLLASLVIVSRLRPASDSIRARWWWALGAGLLMVAWDVSMDPAMVKTGHWAWGGGDAIIASGVPPWLVAFFTADAFYGMPLSNWFGWLLTATLVARAMLSVVPPDEITRRMSRSSLPVALYLANGVMPVALCLREGYWWAAALGALAMGTPAVLAWRGPVTHRSVDLPVGRPA